MTVKELKQLLDGVDENLTVFVFTGDQMDYLSPELSGVSTFGEACDEHGNSIEETLTEEERTFFILFPKTFENDVVSEATA
jgi:hypothetical protein